MSGPDGGWAHPWSFPCQATFCGGFDSGVRGLRLLTTEVECEVVSLPDDAVVLGSNWLFELRVA